MSNEEFSTERRDASPANLLMKIESFSLLSEYEISEYESREFEAGGHKWKIIINLEGEDVSVCLSTSGTESLPKNWEINVIFTFFAFNHFSNDYLCFRGKLRRFNTVATRLRFSKLISKEKLSDNGYLVDDNCVFGAEVFVINGDQRVNASLCLLKETIKMEKNIWNPQDLVLVGDYKCFFMSEPRNVDLYPKENEIIKNKLSIDDAKRHKKVQILSEYSVESRNASPANLLMKIESFSLFSKYQISEFESREFEAGGHKWKIVIYLEGEDVSVCLSAFGMESLPMDGEINVIFTFFVYSHFSNNYLCYRGKPRRLYSVNPKCRFSKVISKERLTDPSNGYIADDKFVFGAEVFVIKVDQRLNECLCLIKDPASVNRSWTLPNFSKMESVWNSEEFKVGGYKWRVTLHPKGDQSAKGRYISIFLNCVDASKFAPHQKVKADASILIRNKLKDGKQSKRVINREWFTLSRPGWGYSEFIAIGDMSSKGLMSFLAHDHDCCFLEIKISEKAVVIDR